MDGNFGDISANPLSADCTDYGQVNCLSRFVVSRIDQGSAIHRQHSYKTAEKEVEDDEVSDVIAINKGASQQQRNSHYIHTKL